MEDVHLRRYPLGMARIARIVVPHVSHCITTRGNHQEDVFFLESDYQLYLDLLRIYSEDARLRLIAYCLMPNHWHMVLWPLEGGVYQWTKFAMGPLMGFLSAWNYALYGMLNVPESGVSADELPTNTSGKVDRRAVRKLVESRLT